MTMMKTAAHTRLRLRLLKPSLAALLAAVDDPRLPANTIDMVLLVDAYHEFEWPYEVMTGIIDSLVSGGRVAPKAGAPSKMAERNTSRRG